MGRPGASWRGLLTVVLPGALVGFVLSYAYIASSAGSTLFRFLVRTLPGNLALATALALLAYHFSRASLELVTGCPTSWRPSTLDYLHEILLLVSLPVALYPAVRAALGVPGALGVLAPLIISLAIPSHAPRRAGQLLGILLLLLLPCLAVTATVLSASDLLSRAYSELTETVSNLERLLRELGVA